MAAQRAPETTVWQGTPSPLLNLPTFLALGVAAVAATVGLLWFRGAAGLAVVGWVPWLILGAWLVCGGAALVAHLRVTSVRYQLTTERLRLTTGIFSTRTEDIELRRVRDSGVERPFLMRLVGLGHVHLVSADPGTPRIALHAVPDPDRLQATIRGLVNDSIQRWGVREIDVI